MGGADSDSDGDSGESETAGAAAYLLRMLTSAFLSITRVWKASQLHQNKINENFITRRMLVVFMHCIHTCRAFFIREALKEDA